MKVLTCMILLAGLGQLGLAAGSLAIPSLLGWKRELEKVSPLVRQIFWTYAGYILATNIAFGLVSVAAPAALLERSTLSGSVTGFITLYWLSRIAIQFLYFDRGGFPSGRWYQAGELALVALFIFLVLVYGGAFLWNLGFGG